MTVYIKENTIIAKLAARFLKENRMAVTVGNKVCLHNCTANDFLKNKSWVCHEIIHVNQYKKYGTIKFLLAYLWQSVINGYVNNRFEKEAHQHEHNILLLNNVNFVIL